MSASFCIREPKNSVSLTKHGNLLNAEPKSIALAHWQNFQGNTVGINLLVISLTGMLPPYSLGSMLWGKCSCNVSTLL